MVVSARRVALLVVALGALTFGAALGRYAECNAISLSNGASMMTAVGCPRPPAWWGPLSLVVAVVATLLACRPVPGDSPLRRVRLRAVAGVGLVMTGVAVVLFAALRPGVVDIAGYGPDFPCHRPADDLRSTSNDTYTAACRDLAEGRLLVVVLVGAALLVALVVVAVAAVRRRGAAAGRGTPPAPPPAAPARRGRAGR